MKKVFVILVAIIIVGLTACDGESNFLIKVSGTQGLSFTGSYLTTTANGQANSKSVEGTVPAQYSVTGTIVSATFQKQAEQGSLKVEIVKNNQVIISEETTAAYGVVSVATS